MKKTIFECNILMFLFMKQKQRNKAIKQRDKNKKHKKQEQRNKEKQQRNREWKGGGK